MTGRWWLVLVVLSLAGACGGGGGKSLPASTATSAGATTSAVPTSVPTTGPTTTRGTATSPGTATRPPSTTVTTRPAGVAVALSDGDRGRAVSLHSGDSVTVTLHSTYWSFLDPSNPAVLQLQGAPVTAPEPPPACVPGGGCGTVTARFRAAAPGRGQLAAHRDSCGEAMRCGPGAGDWSVTVTVTS